MARSPKTLWLGASALIGAMLPLCVSAQTAGTPAAAALKAAGKPEFKPSWNPGLSPSLRPVEAGVGDTGALSTSPRELRVDLRQAAGFDRVYQLPWKAGTGGLGRPGDFVRFDSGVAAVFARSQYAQSVYGPVAKVPAGTTFYIGRLPDSVLRSGNLTQAQSSLLRVDRSVNMWARSEQPTMNRPLPSISTRVDRRVNSEAEKQRPEARSERTEKRGEQRAETRTEQGSEPATPPTLMTDASERDRWIDQLGAGDKH